MTVVSSPTGLDDCLAALSRRAAGELRTDRYSRLLYSTDASIYQVEPLAVLIPRTIEDVHLAVELASTYQVPLLPRTAGSSLAGQAVNQALVIDMSRHLDQVLAVDVEARQARVQPGIVLDELNGLLRPLGLQFGPDPASSDRAAMGGIAANNSTGAHSILYGMTADHVAAMSVVLSDGSRCRFEAVEDHELEECRRRGGLEGEIYRGLTALLAQPANRESIRAGTPRHWRRCGGYNLDRFVGDGVAFRLPAEGRFNLAKLVCGSEGTLAVITDLTLNLVPVPARTALALVHFDDLHTALSAVPVILEAEPSAIELLDHLALTLCRDVPEYARLLATFVEGDPDCLLITEFQGDSDSQLASRVDRLGELLRRERAGAVGIVAALDPHQQRNVWKVRKVGLGLLMSIRGDHKPIPFIEDAAVPVEHLASYIRQLEDFCSGLGTRVAYYAHASAGCLHVRPLIDTKSAAEIAKLPEILDFAVDLLRGYGGAMSSEHGDGRARSWMNERFFGPDLYALYRQVKRLFDPRNLLNPGIVVDAPAMTEHLRFGAGYRATPLPTHIDFRREQGLDRAIEMCNGAGVCRKRTTGTMCPSFMVTRDEEHSTRGRANALRSVLAGRLPASEWTSRRMHRVMDLCLACKACKAECPSSVDMAKLKLEFLARYHEANGTPLRAELLGHVADAAWLASGLTAPLVNTVLASAAARFVLEKTVGLTRRRRLPPLARRPFSRWFGKSAPTGSGDNGRAVLFHDTFNNFFTPRVAIAATEVLTAAGFTVELPRHGCCGRPLLSAGLVAEARAAARHTLAGLAPLAESGLPIVGLEPSCLLTLRDEYFDLLPGDRRVEIVAARARTFEEFVAEQHAAGRLALRFRAAPRNVLLHGHCHEKALIGSEPALGTLSLPPGYVVAEIDSGCCGMAGSFGFEAEHYELSRQLAERRLWPAVREAGAETVIAAAGVSCRQQIEHGTGRRALHPAEVLRDALAPPPPEA